MSPLNIKLNNCFSNEIGKLGISKPEYIRTFDQLKLVRNRIKQEFLTNQIPFLNHIADDSEIKKITTIVNQLSSKFNHIIIFAVGGSSLGGKTICSLLPNKKATFVDYIDYHDFKNLVSSISFEDTCALFISKSGETLETLAQSLIIIDIFKEKLLNYQESLYFLTENTTNTLRKIAESIGSTIFDHPTSVGGRYSCFTNVALIPAAFAGIDIKAFINGARTVLEAFIGEEDNPVTQSSTITLNMLQKNITNFVMIPYIRRLKSFNDWYSQLWAESLGKCGLGSTPIKAMGSVDQHSQLQLYIDGPKDKYFTFITTDTKNFGHKFNRNLVNLHNLDYLNGCSLGDLTFVEQEATIETIKNSGSPVRNIILDKVDPYCLGSLMMFFMLETIMTGYALNINPFDQPAVEEGKKIAKIKLREICQN